ncbi:MAG: DUF6768 family protein [Planctomycetota bacterium]|jgi:hypothetical protein
MEQEKITDSPQEYDDSKEDTLCSMMHDFYNRKMLPSIILVWVYALVFIAVAVFSGVNFFRAEQVKYQIMYTVIFVCCTQFIALMKIFAWQMIHRNRITRELKRLQLSIAELARMVKEK